MSVVKIKKQLNVISTKNYKRRYRKLIKHNPLLEAKITKVINSIMLDPLHPGLKTHKVNSKFLDKAFSTRVTGDIRIIWSLEKANIVIILIDIGGHDDVY